MILQTIRAVTDALLNETYGLNVQLLTLDLDGLDVRPDPVLSIIDQSRSNDASVGRFNFENHQESCLAVNLAEPVTMQGEVMNFYRDGEVAILIRYVRTNAGQTARSASDVFYIMQATQKAMRQFFGNDHAVDRVRNNVQLIECLSMVQAVGSFDADNDTIFGSLELTIKTRDSNP